MQSDLRVGFIGLGEQGAPIVDRIIAAGFPTAVWARRAASTRPFEGRASIVSSPAEVAACSDVVGICVWDDDDVAEVVLGTDGVMSEIQAGSVIAVHATTSPELCRHLGEEAARRGCTVVDAPVSGGAERARQGTLVVMAGGDAASIERCRPVFEAFGSPVVRTGGLGTGQTVKLLNNTMFAAQLALAIEVFELGTDSGIDKSALAECLVDGSGTSRALQFHAQRMLSEEGPFPPSKLFQKDVALCAALPGLATSAMVEIARRHL